jgi:hypothetical protein
MHILVHHVVCLIASTERPGQGGLISGDDGRVLETADNTILGVVEQCNDWPLDVSRSMAAACVLNHMAVHQLSSHV